MPPVVFVVSLCLLVHGVLLQQLQGEYIRTPGGLRHRSCVIQVESGSTVLRGSDGSVTIIYPPKPILSSGSRNFGQKFTLPPCQYRENISVDLGDFCSVTDPNAQCQYINYAYDNRLNITAFNASWNTPKIPQSNANNFWSYYWTGMWNSASSALFQPVLGWNYLPNTWAAASWYVIGATGYAVHSTFMKTEPNSVGFGAMYRQPDGSYMVSYEDTTAKQSTYLVAKDVAGYFNSGQVVHEQWAHFDCDEQPTSSITFSQMNLAHGTSKVVPQWSSGGTHSMAKCGDTMNVQDTATVVFNF